MTRYGLSVPRGLLTALLALVLLALSACSGGPSSTPTYTVGGTVSGLVPGESVVLSVGANAMVTVTQDGSFTIPHRLDAADLYTVTVQTQPDNEACTVDHASGQITAPVSNVVVTCTQSVYSVGGTVTGLSSGASVVVQNSSDMVTVSANGIFTFPTQVPADDYYGVTVATQPAGETCSVAGGIGSENAPDIRSVRNAVVTCSANTYTVGGTIQGLSVTGLGLVLELAGNANNTLVTPGDTTFSLPALASGTSYSVVVEVQPLGLACSVTDGTGTVQTSNVTNVAVSCTDQPLTLSGSISGNSAPLVLTNGSTVLDIPAGTTSFQLSVPYNDSYALTAAASGLTCSVSNGNGKMPAGNLSNVAVTCSDQAFTVGGTASGLAGTSVVLLDNGDDALTVAADGPFTFATPVADASAYAVTIQTQPAGLFCTSGMGFGTVATQAVTNVAITCSQYTLTIAGTISGLSATGLVLANGIDRLSVAAGAMIFSMPAGVAVGSDYDVTVEANPPGESCTVSNGSGTASAEVSNVSITCSPGTGSAGAGLDSPPGEATS